MKTILWHSPNTQCDNLSSKIMRFLIVVLMLCDIISGCFELKVGCSEKL